MSFYVVRLQRGGPWDWSRDMRKQAGWDEHARFMDGLVDAGFILLGGPLEGDHETLHIVEAIPYGIYDVERNVGWVNVGRDHETATFAVESLRRWWRGDGGLACPEANRLLICADGGGSNGYRVRLSKYELDRFASETGLTITVCHLPPGTSKWNKIEHRLFAHISMNWPGRPLTSHEVVLELIGATTTKQGLKVHAQHDLGTYPPSVIVSDARMAEIRLGPHDFHGEWNYTVSPRLDLGLRRGS